MTPETPEQVWIAAGIDRRYRVLSCGHTFGEWDTHDDAKTFLRLLVTGNARYAELDVATPADARSTAAESYETRLYRVELLCGGLRDDLTALSNRIELLIRHYTETRRETS